MNNSVNKIAQNIFFCLLLLSSFLLASNSHAYKLIPLSVEMSPSGKGARQSFRIENPSEVPIAIELKMFSRKMTPEGKDELSEAEDDFIVHPSQAIIMPGKTQAIRLQWIGDPQPKQELAYRMITEQIPVSFGEEQLDGGVVRLLVRFIASVYIVPRNTRPIIKVTSVSNIYGSDGKSNLAIKLTNEGSAHALLRKTRLTLTSQDHKIELGPEDVPMMSSQNILAGHHRVFIIPKPEGFVSDEINASISYLGQ